MDPELERVVNQLLSERRKIEAIKVYKEATGVGLKEAKDFVEAISAGAVAPTPSLLNQHVKSAQAPSSSYVSSARRPFSESPTNDLANSAAGPSSMQWFGLLVLAGLVGLLALVLLR